MAHYDDLTEYIYKERFKRQGSLNVGWLALGKNFDQKPASKEFLDKLWRICTVSVARTRGFHFCELCPASDSEVIQELTRDGERLVLGTAEIRVFGTGDVIFAAPNLIFHYVSVHHYDPPAEFVAAVLNNPAPPDRGYFERLKDLAYEWDWTFGLEKHRPRQQTKDGLVFLDEWGEGVPPIQNRRPPSNPQP